jgi:large subunit ribosomal protein L18e
MAKRTGPTNYQLQTLLLELEPRARESPFWKRIAEDLNKSTRERRIVNIYKLNQYAKEGETVIVPGKVLSVGELDKKLNVAALNFSVEAKQKILTAKGKIFSIRELLQKNPAGKGIRILG